MAGRQGQLSNCHPRRCGLSRTFLALEIAPESPTSRTIRIPMTMAASPIAGSIIRTPMSDSAHNETTRG